MNLKDWQILKNGKRSDFAVIVVITMIFLIVIELNVRLIFQMTSNQTEEIGQMQLEVIRSDFQGSLQEAESTTLRVAMEAEQLLKANTSHQALEAFFNRRKREQKNLTGGVCFNVYIANKNWAIIPDFKMPPDYHATERLWYKGAVQNPGKVYITEPYIDAMTGMMCFTMSKMLQDNQTVVALDFTFSEVQYFIRKMSANRNREALIVTKSGMIIGYTDMDLVGEKISKRLPEYENILNRVVKSDRNESFTTEMSDGEHTIFTGSTMNGWHIILNVDNWAFYKDSYMQIIFTALICLLMMLAIIFFYLNAMRNGLRAENALHIKEEFLSRLSHELRDPVKNILNLSSVETIKSNANPTESAAQVRESALRLSDMLDNLFSFSNIVSSNKDKFSDKKTFQNEELEKVSRYARIRIIMVLIAAMALAFGICLTMTISWGDTKMNREVDAYEYQLSNWLEKEKSILSMFVNIIGNHPEYMNDYPNAVKFLDDIAKKYPEISVCYLANPFNEHQVIMNNGWESPDPSWRVNKRPWYIETERSEDGFSVSAPYYDSQTGLYCVTLAQIVYGKNHEFIGIFAIDFYLDRLIKILDISYTKDSYAFLVDRNNVIINHPNIDYQQSPEHMTDVSTTEYANVYPGSGVHTLQDYTGGYVACLAKRDTASNFTVIVANSWWNIYGNNILLGGLFIILLVMCILIINGLINQLFKWQETMNRQLKSASDTALAASQAKSQFLAQMSHEIRTPINAVLGMNEMILRESKSEEILDYATNIQSAGKTLLTLINSILDFSKIEDGKMEIVPVRYDTINLIDDLVNMTVERAKKKGIEFKTEIDSNLPQSLYGDDVRVRQVIVNLLTNAVKYTPEGSVTLTIDGKIIDADNYEMRVKVSDTGIGIHEDDIDKLFLSFQRLDEEKNRNIEGTGLGISIVQRLLDMMDSKLEVGSEYGKGSTFSFTLRQKIIDKNPIGNYEEERKKHVDKSGEKKYLTAEGARVLAVDDNDMNLKVISGLLKRNKIFPDLAESGQQGIEMAKQNFYHIIFMDNMMPGMSGVETLKVMQRDKILSDKTSVVMLTASAIAGVREEYLREGFDDYLSKPINVSELELILERHLPAEIVSFEVERKEKAIRNEELGIGNVEDVEVEEPEENVGEDEFSKREKKIFVETCPDINLEVALQYCMNSKSFLTQMLTTYTDNKRSGKIQAAFDSGDWKNYQILVHALKSTSLSIGAEKLSELAKHLELAAKDNNVEEIQTNHAALMTDYKKIREQISKWLTEDTPEEEEIVGEDEFSKREKKIFVETCPDINLELALQYCMNSKSFLTQMLTTYTDGKKAEKIQAAFDSGDWKNYQILVHALKSTSLSIGAEKLSELAKHLELAAKDNNVEEIQSNHAALMTDYKKIREQISKWLEASS
ncbi:MAG: response regulator [Selenomonadaceae bacterium]|nr:response regulator [Selenomonadaceae bacterium]